MKNNKFNLGIYAFASMVSVAAVGLLIKSRITRKNDELEEINTLSEEIDIFDIESDRE